MMHHTHTGTRTPHMHRAPHQKHKPYACESQCAMMTSVIPYICWHQLSQRIASMQASICANLLAENVPRNKLACHVSISLSVRLLSGYFIDDHSITITSVSTLARATYTHAHRRVISIPAKLPVSVAFRQTLRTVCDLEIGPIGPEYHI